MIQAIKHNIGKLLSGSSLSIILAVIGYYFWGVLGAVIGFFIVPLLAVVFIGFILFMIWIFKLGVQ